MKFKELERLIVADYRKRKPRRKRLARFLSVVEEVGEVAACFIAKLQRDNYKNSDFEEEVADVFMNVVALARDLKVNLEKAVMRKIQKDKKNRGAPIS